MEHVLIVDGDVVCYGACRNRWGTKEEQDMREEGTLPDFTEEEDEQYIKDCMKNFDNIIEYLREHSWSTLVRIAVKGDNNFRDRIHPGYKASRKKKTRPVAAFVELVREHAVVNHGAVQSHGMEADDLVRIWANEARSSGHEFSIASIDKDLLCIPGNHLRFKKGSGSAGLGFPTETTVVSEFEALQLYYKQILTGDSTDDIPGIYRLGPKTADKLIAPCATEGEMQEVVMQAYQDAFGKNWAAHLLFNGSLITILPSYDYTFSIKDWQNADVQLAKEF